MDDVLVENENGLGVAAVDVLLVEVLPAKENLGNAAGVELEEEENETLANGLALAEHSPVVDCVGFARVVDAKGLEDFCCCDAAGIFGATTAPAVPPPPPNLRLLQISEVGCGEQSCGCRIILLTIYE